MKKLIYLTAVAGSLLLTTSCVDLTQEPESFITEEEYWNTVDQASLEKAADALYSDLWQGNYGFNSRLQRINVCADDITYRAAKANNELAYYSRLTPNLTANDADFSTTWTLFYKVISSSNKIIKGTTIPTNEKEAKAFKEVLGEAYFMRGLSYFYLTRLYGDVPLLLENDEATITMPRTSVAEIYDKAIIPSLTTATEWLPNKGRSGNSTPSKWAAKACLADAYMTMGNKKSVDIWIIKDGEPDVSIDVKSVRASDSIPVGNVKAKSDHYVVFVIYNNKFEDTLVLPDFYIVPSNKVVEYSRKFNGGRINIFKKDIEQYKNAWEQLELPNISTKFTLSEATVE